MDLKPIPLKVKKEIKNEVKSEFKQEPTSNANLDASNGIRRRTYRKRKHRRRKRRRTTTKKRSYLTSTRRKKTTITKKRTSRNPKISKRQLPSSKTIKDRILNKGPTKAYRSKLLSRLAIKHSLNNEQSDTVTQLDDSTDDKNDIEIVDPPVEVFNQPVDSLKLEPVESVNVLPVKIEPPEIIEDIDNEKEEGEIVEVIKKECDSDPEQKDVKIKRCKHGKVITIRKDKEKARDVPSRCLKHTSSSKEKKPLEESEILDTIETSSNKVDDTKYLHVVVKQEKEELEDSKEDSSLWKKPSSHSKLRSYRDGKPKDKDVLFRERELPKKERMKNYLKDESERKKRRNNHDDRSRREYNNESKKHYRIERSGEERHDKQSIEDSRRNKRDRRHDLEDHNRLKERRSKHSSSREREKIRKHRSDGSESDHLRENRTNKHDNVEENRRKAKSSPIKRKDTKPDLELNDIQSTKLKSDSKRSHNTGNVEIYSSDEIEEILKNKKKHKRSHSHHHHHHYHHKNVDSNELQTSIKLEVNDPIEENSNGQQKLKQTHQQQHRHAKKSDNHHSSKHENIDNTLDKELSPKLKISSKRLLSGSHSGFSSEVTPLDSKEIYAEGDKIIVNVNFSKKLNSEEFNDEKELNENEINEHNPKSGDELEDLLFENLEDNDVPKKELKLKSKSNIEFDIFFDEESNGNKSDKSDNSDYKNRKSDSDSRSAKREEVGLRFLPRTLIKESILVSGVKHVPESQTVHQSISTTGPKTPPDNEDRESLTLSSPDHLMPTPTQDESQLDSLDSGINPTDNDIRSNAGSSIKSLSSPIESIKDKTKNKSQDIYDPEAPLGSPSDDELFIALDQKSDSNFNTQAAKSSPKASKGRKSPVDTKIKLDSLCKPREHSGNSATNLNNTNPTSSSIIGKITNTLSTNFHSTQLSKSAPQQIHQQLKSSKSVNNASGMCYSVSKTNSSRDMNEVVDMDVASPYSPPQQSPQTSLHKQSLTARLSSANATMSTVASSMTNKQQQNSANSLQAVIDQLLRVAQVQQTKTSSVSHKSGNSNLSLATFKRPHPPSRAIDSSKKTKSDIFGSSTKSKHHHSHHHTFVKTKITGSNSDPNKIFGTKSMSSSSSIVAGNIKISDVAVLEDCPSSAVELQVKEKYLKKLNRQERVVEEVKVVLKPFYQRRDVTKEEYKEIMRKSVPKICHSKSGEINPVKIKQLIESYIKKMKQNRQKGRRNLAN